MVVNMASIQNAEKKFKALTNTQEGIQVMSLWVNHHKAHNEKIVNVWFKVLKKSQLSHRLTLFNLCNDVVQTCKRKGAAMYKIAFKGVLKDAVPLVREPSVRPNVERIFRIWGERGIFDTAFVDELQALLANSQAREAVNTRLLADFKPQKVLEKLLTFRKFELETELKKTQLNSELLDISPTDALKQLKDHRHSKEFSIQYEETCKRLEEYVSCLEKEMRDRSGLTVLLERSELYYDAQYGEARIVANAYKNFGSRVSNMKRKLDSVIEDLPNIPSPIPSPTIDVPSPGNTPPQEKNKLDITEAIDMELSEEEQTKPAIQEIDMRKYKRRKKSHRHKENNENDGKVVEQKAPDNDVMMYDPLLESKLEQTNSWSASVTEPTQTQPTWQAKNNLTEIFTENTHDSNNTASYTPPLQTGDSTPVKDECPGTPVQDEPCNSNPLSTNAVTSNVDAAVKNPIEFLTQLISQTQNTTSNADTSNQGPSNSFLQSLTALAQPPLPQTQSDDSSSANTWAQWKAQSHDDPVPHMGASHVSHNISPTGVQPPTLPSGTLPDTAVPPPIFASPPPASSVPYDPQNVPTSPTIMYPSNSRVMLTPPTPNYSNSNVAPLATPPIKPTYGGMNQSPPFMGGPPTPLGQWQQQNLGSTQNTTETSMGATNNSNKTDFSLTNDQQDFIDKLKRRSSVSGRSDTSDRTHDGPQPTGPPPHMIPPPSGPMPTGPPPSGPLPTGPPPNLSMTQKPTGPPPNFNASSDNNIGSWNNDQPQQNWNQQQQSGNFYNNNQQQQQQGGNFQQQQQQPDQQQYGFNPNHYQQQQNTQGFQQSNQQYQPRPALLNTPHGSGAFRPRF